MTIGLEGLRVAVRESTGETPTAGQIRSTLLAIGVGVLALFVVAPGVLAAVWPDPWADIGEGAGRAGALLVYLSLVSRSPGAQRLFSYHGAEHKVIAAYEQRGIEATMDDARARSPIHPRCGTNFVSLFVIVAGVLHSFVPRSPLWAAAAWRVALAPVDAALAYELMRSIARRRSPLRLLAAPGLALQRITTREPDDAQLDVARTALAGALGLGSHP